MARCSGGVGVTGSIDLRAVRAMVQRSCEAQGLPVKVSTPAVVESVATLLGSSNQASSSRSSRTSARLRSEAEDGHGAGGVDVVDPGGAGVNDDVVKDRLDDRSLSTEVQGGSLGS